MRFSFITLAIASAVLALPTQAYSQVADAHSNSHPKRPNRPAKHQIAKRQVATSHVEATGVAGQPTIETLVIVGEKDSDPTRIVTDPKMPRQPLPASDGADYLKTITGFQLVRKGGASADPVFRGMAGSRLAIVNDGHSLLGGCGSRMDPPTAYITPQHFDEIVVIKGPQSLRYGPALGTVLFNKQNNVVQSELSATMARFGRRELTADVNQQSAAWQGRVLASTAQADDYQSGVGDSLNSAYKRWSVDGELSYQPTEDAKYQLALGASDGEAAYADRLMDGSQFRRDSVALSTEHRQLAPWLTAVRTQWYQNDVDHVMDNYSLRAFVPSMMMKNQSASNPTRLTQGGRLEADLAASAYGQAMVGFDGQYNRHQVRSSMNQPLLPYQQQTLTPDASFHQLGAFTEWQSAVSDRTSAHQRWLAGARVDRWQANDHRAQLTSMMGMPKTNPTYQATRDAWLTSSYLRYEQRLVQSDWYLGLGHASRAPDYWELIGNNRAGASSLSAFYTKPEYTTQLDGSWRYFGKQWRFSSSAYLGHVDNFVLLQAATMLQPERVRNVDARIYGGELAWQWSFLPAWQLASSVAASFGDNLTDHQPLAQQPPLEARLSLNYQQQDWQLGMLWRAVRAQHQVAIGQGTIAGFDQRPTAGFATFAINATWQWSVAQQLSMGLDNLFDRDYAEHLNKAATTIVGYPSRIQVPEPGRVWWVKWDYRFN